MKRIKTGDTVIVITGKSKGHVGKVTRVLGEDVIVEGANLIKKHVKPNPRFGTKGWNLLPARHHSMLQMLLFTILYLKRRIRLDSNTLRKTVKSIRLDTLNQTMK